MKPIIKKTTTINLPEEEDNRSGPSPERRIIEEDWQDAMGKELALKKPADGWPKSTKSEKK